MSYPQAIRYSYLHLEDFAMLKIAMLKIAMLKIAMLKIAV